MKNNVSLAILTLSLLGFPHPAWAVDQTVTKEEQYQHIQALLGKIDFNKEDLGLATHEISEWRRVYPDDPGVNFIGEKLAEK